MIHSNVYSEGSATANSNANKVNKELADKYRAREQAENIDQRVELALAVEKDLSARERDFENLVAANAPKADIGMLDSFIDDLDRNIQTAPEQSSGLASELNRLV